MGRATPGFRGGYQVDGSRHYTLAIFGAVLMRSLAFLAHIAIDCLAKSQTAYNPCSRCERVIGGFAYEMTFRNNLCQTAINTGRVA